MGIKRIEDKRKKVECNRGLGRAKEGKRVLREERKGDI